MLKLTMLFDLVIYRKKKQCEKTFRNLSLINQSNIQYKFNFFGWDPQVKGPFYPPPQFFKCVVYPAKQEEED